MSFAVLHPPAKRAFFFNRLLRLPNSFSSRYPYAMHTDSSHNYSHASYYWLAGLGSYELNPTDIFYFLLVYSKMNYSYCLFLRTS